MFQWSIRIHSIHIHTEAGTNHRSLMGFRNFVLEDYEVSYGKWCLEKKKKKKWARTCQTPINAIPVLFLIQREIRKKKVTRVCREETLF